MPIRVNKINPKIANTAKTISCNQVGFLYKFGKILKVVLLRPKVASWLRLTT